MIVRRRGAAGMALRALLASSLSLLLAQGCVPYTTAYKPDRSATRTFVRVDPAAPGTKSVVVSASLVSPSADGAGAATLGLRLSRVASGPGIEVTESREQRYRHFWSPLLIPVGVIALAELPVMAIMSPILHSNKSEGAFRVWGGHDPKGCDLKDFVTVMSTFIVGVGRSCEAVGEPRITESVKPAGKEAREETPLAGRPFRVRLLADGAPLPAGKGERKGLTGDDGSASLPLVPLVAELPDTVRSAEVEVSAEGEGAGAAPAKLAVPEPLLLSLLGPLREERLGDEAARDGRGIAALERYGRAVALRKETGGGTPLFRKFASAYSSLPVKPPVPEEVRRLLVQAEALAKENDGAGAGRKLEEALRQAPWLPVAWYNRAFQLVMEKDYRGAIRAMENYLLLAPDAPDARQAKDQIYQWEALAPPAAQAEGGTPTAAGAAFRGDARQEKAERIRRAVQGAAGGGSR